MNLRYEDISWPFFTVAVFVALGYNQGVDKRSQAFPEMTRVHTTPLSVIDGLEQVSFIIKQRTFLTLLCK